MNTTFRPFTRRQFLSASAIAAVGLTLPFSTQSATRKHRKVGANDRIQVGVIGLGGRAAHILRNEQLATMPDVDVVAVADCDLSRLNGKKDIRGNDKWHKYQHYQEMLEKEKLDAVFIETTTHARVLACIHALQAGLDVYGEKPLTLTIAEGQTLVKAVRKYKRILQTGSQQRSMPINIYASDLVREGKIGKIREVLTCNFLPGKVWQNPGKTESIPKGLDWDAWCNQTDLRPYSKDLQHGWGNYVDYDDGGQSWGVSGWGTHSLDQVQCALGTDSTGPVEIWPEEPGPAGKVTARYANGTLLKMHNPKRPTHEDLGAIFVGEKGTIEILRGDFRCTIKELRDAAPPVLPEGPGESVPHIRNFFDCMRSRKQPNADVEVGHRSVTLCHLVTICRTLGRKLNWDPKREQFHDDKEANALLSRPRRAGYELPVI